MKRKLASIQVIESVEPIPGADLIEMIRVLGWRCVAKKGEFKHGDLCVYFEIDSVLPDETWCEFLKDDRRIRTRKFRGQISQGLALPVPSVIDSRELDLSLLRVGDDVSTVLAVIEYERPDLSSDACGPFPSHYGIVKTDEMMIQSYPQLLDEMRGRPYVVTEKIDGTSCTIVLSTDEVIVASRSAAIREADNWYWKVYRKYDLGMKRHDVILQGEIHGPGIQKNRKGTDDISLAVFDVFNILDKSYVSHDVMEPLCSIMGVPTVEVVERGDSFSYDVDDLVELSRGVYQPSGNPREGIVVRPAQRIYSPTLGRDLSFKVLNPDHLMKYS